ncbi:MAG: hypothetical protein QXU67_04695, partial [Candidatus Bathyarchaeia archaeon]
MRRILKNKQGQFVIALAIVMSIIILSAAFSIYQMNIQRQQLKYEPAKEIALAITSDLERALAVALSFTSQKYDPYNSTGNNEAISKGLNLIFKWMRSVAAAYSHLGAKMNISVPENGQGGGTSVVFNLDWDGNPGMSYLYTVFELDVDAYGFEGWTGRAQKTVLLTIFSETMEIVNETEGLAALKFNLRDNGKPVPNLTLDLLSIYAHKNGRLWIPATIKSLKYLGGGNYTVEFSPINKYSLGVILKAVTPQENIVVSARHMRSEAVTINLKSKQDDGLSKNYGWISLITPVDPEYFNETFTLPSIAVVSPDVYLLVYTPKNSSYAFLNWTITGGIGISNIHGQTTLIGVYGDGNITAFYRLIPEPPGEICLSMNSREFSGSSFNLGRIELDQTTYNLPYIVNITSGTYPIRYIPENSSYTFLYWDSNGEISVENSMSANTTLTVFGNGSLTAVYSLPVSGSQIPQLNDWSTLYLGTPSNKSGHEKGVMLLPTSLWSGDNGQYSPQFSHGKDKEWAIIYSPPTPYQLDITSTSYINITIYAQPDPPKGSKNISVTLSFIYPNGTEIIIAESEPQPFPSEGWYTFTVPRNGDFGGIIP